MDKEEWNGLRISNRKVNEKIIVNEISFLRWKFSIYSVVK